MFEATTGVPDAKASVSTMPKLTAERGRTEQVGLAQQSPLSSSSTRPAISTPSGSSSSGSTSSGVAPAIGQAGLHAGAAQGLEGAQEHRQPLAFLGAAHEQQPQLVVGSRRIGPGSGQVHAVGNDAIAASVEALGGPASGLGDRDPGAQLRVEAACSADVRGDVVGQEACGIRVERGHGRPRRCLSRKPGHPRRVGLVDVDYVVAARAQLAAQLVDCVGEHREVRNRSVHRQADRAAQWDHVIG